jgi:hypothetical protein
MADLTLSGGGRYVLQYIFEKYATLVYEIDWHNIKYQHCIYIVTESYPKSFGCSGRSYKLLYSHQIGPQSFELQRPRLTGNQQTIRCPRRLIVMHNTTERGWAIYWIVCGLHWAVLIQLPSVCRAVNTSPPQLFQLTEMQLSRISGFKTYFQWPNCVA